MTRTIGIVASGPSLTLGDCAFLRKKCDLIIAVNDSWRMVSADFIYAADAHWWQHHHHDIACGFTGKKWSCETPNKTNWGKRDALEWGVNLFTCDIGGSGLSTDPGMVVGGQNSGYQAIGLARHILHENGGTGGRIILIGYDMTWTNGKSHWFGDHPEGTDTLPRLNNVQPDKYAANFRTIDPEKYGLEIINCSRSTKLDAFECRKLEDVF